MASKNTTTAVRVNSIQFFMIRLSTCIAFFLFFHCCFKPLGHDLQIRRGMRTVRFDLMAYRRETFDVTVMHVPMTFPAGTVGSVVMMVFHKIVHVGIYHLL